MMLTFRHLVMNIAFVLMATMIAFMLNDHLIPTISRHTSPSSLMMLTTLYVAIVSFFFLRTHHSY